MGKTQSTMKVLTEVLNSTTIEFMAENSSSTSTSVVQSRKISVIASGGSTVKGIDAKQLASINLNEVVSQVLNADMMNQLINKLDTAVKNTNVELPSLGSDQEMEIRNIIKNTTEEKFSIKNIEDTKLSVSQLDDITIAAVGESTAEDLRFMQEADIVVKLVKSNSAAIAEKLLTGNSSASSAESDKSNVLTKGLDTLAKATDSIVKSGVSMFKTAMSGSTIMIVLFIIAATILAIMAKPWRLFGL